MVISIIYLIAASVFFGSLALTFSVRALEWDWLETLLARLIGVSAIIIISISVYSLLNMWE